MKKEHLQMLKQLSIREFIERLSIVNKDGQLQTLSLNEEQEQILEKKLKGFLL